MTLTPRASVSEDVVVVAGVAVVVVAAGIVVVVVVEVVVVVVAEAVIVVFVAVASLVVAVVAFVGWLLVLSVVLPLATSPQREYTEAAVKRGEHWVCTAS